MPRLTGNAGNESTGDLIMNEDLIVLSFTMVNPDDAAALGDLDFYQNVPCDITIVYVCCASDTDDADLSIDINDDGAAGIAAISCPVKADPGEWISTHFGGSETPVYVAAGSELSFDANDAAAATTVHITVWALTSGVWA
jgi:hypothetical protein